MEPRWFELMREYFGVNLTADRVGTWLKLLNAPDGCRDVTEDELCRVIRWVRQKRERDGEHQKAPTLETLIMWVRWYRKDEAANRRGYNPASPEGYIPAIKALLLAAKDTEERLDIMYEPQKYMETDRDRTVSDWWALYRWCAEKWPKFGPEAEAIRKQRADEFHAAWQAVLAERVDNAPIVKTNRAYSEKVARREEAVPF
jgi:hypothetical protein